MRKVALVFVIAVIAPSLVLAWLAVRSLRDQEAVLEHQQTLLYQSATDAVAARLRAQVDELRSEFESEVAALLRETEAAALSSRFDPALRARWPLAEIGFVVALDGDLLAPSMFEGADARQFRVDNTRFLCSSESFEVYWNGPKGSVNLTKLDQKEASASASAMPVPGSGTKLKAVRTLSPTKDLAPDALASKLAPEAKAFRQIVQNGESGLIARFLHDELNVLFWYRPPLDKPLVFGARVGLARLVERVRDGLVLEPPLNTQIAVALINAAGRPVAVAPSGFAPPPASGRTLMPLTESPATQHQASSAFSTSVASSAFPVAPAQRAPAPSPATVTSSGVSASSSLGQVSIAGAGGPSAARADWTRPFVATEIGEMLPNWEVAAYVMDPRQLGRSAAATRITVGLLIAVLVLAISIGSWLIVRDLQRQLALARQKTDFVSNVSHELKTPLTSIRMFSEMLAEGRVEEEHKRRQFLNIITAEAARLTRLINNVLDFARLERGEKRYQFTRIDLATLAQETVELYRPHLEASGFALNFRNEGLGKPTDGTDRRNGINGTQGNDANGAQQPLAILGDQDALAQVMVNLLSNAEKYSEDRKEIEVVLDAGPKTSSTRSAAQQAELDFPSTGPCEWAEWTVLDRGRGVPRGCEDKIFEQFYRAHDSLADGVQGSGLGLTLARQIAEAHGGSVTYAPREGGGSCFTLRLPRVSSGNAGTADERR